MSTPRRALVASDSHIAKDTRILYQITWLREAGWTVDTLGRGPASAEADGAHYEMPLRPFWQRLLANTLLPRRLRYQAIVRGAIPRELSEATARYDLTIMNEVELLPWFAEVESRLLAPGGTRHLDLHEYSLSQRRGLVHELFFRRYRDWLAGFIGSPIFTTRSTVSDGIADLYVETIGIPRPAIVRSCPEFVEQQPSDVDAGDIRLLHHGGAQAIRSPELMIDAMEHLDERFSLHLMLIGSPRLVADLRRRAEPYGDRVQFHPPVGVRDVARAVNPYDLEVIFYPPFTQNLRYALPNKVFEAVQGRLGLVVGESPDMAGITRRYDMGVVVEGWTGADLARALNAVTADDVRRFKAAADTAADDLNVDAEARMFFAAIGAAGA
ncbi:MAG TPA: hypothetical protein VNR36_14035 [Pseudolysinimonas sp.]|nr:hypothetical protein [Pseudolysinimonas sp.]